MPAKPKSIVVVGSINLDLVASVDRLPEPGETLSGTAFAMHPGGKGANQAVAAARLGHPVSLIGKLGTDSFADQLRQSLRKDGVDIDAVTTVPGSSGVAVILLTPAGENSIIVIPGANAHLTPDDLDEHLPLLQSAGIVLTQLEIPIPTVERLAEICHDNAVPLILDPAPAQMLPASLFARITWFTPNETEAAFYARELTSDTGAEAEDLLAALLHSGPVGIVLKQGSRGVHLASSTDSFNQQILAFPVEPVDTTAAGDCFNGAFAVALLQGQSAAESARFANAAAALSTTKSGAQPSMPNLAEVQQLLRS